MQYVIVLAGFRAGGFTSALNVRNFSLFTSDISNDKYALQEARKPKRSEFTKMKRDSAAQRKWLAQATTNCSYMLQKVISKLFGFEVLQKRRVP